MSDSDASTRSFIKKKRRVGGPRAKAALIADNLGGDESDNDVDDLPDFPDNLPDLVAPPPFPKSAVSIPSSGGL